MELVRGGGDARPAGQALAVMNANGGIAAYVPAPNPKRWKPLRGVLNSRGESSLELITVLRRPPVPDTSRRVVVHRLSSNFAAATRLCPRRHQCRAKARC